MIEPRLKKDQPWRVDFYQPGPVHSRNLSVVQSDDELWYIFHNQPEYGTVLMAFTGGGFLHQEEAVNETLSYLREFRGQVTVS